jgi:metallo-beta-lactamase family protein
MSYTPKITFCSGVGIVTGANFLLECNLGLKILIDCGMVQGERFDEEINRDPFSYNPVSIQVLIITHAHLDHIGRIPKLVKEGFQGKIYSTPQTKALAELVLNDAASILALEAKQDGITPLYDLNDVQAVFPLWHTIEYHEKLDISSNLSIVLKDAGHILGSAMVEFNINSIIPEDGMNMGDADASEPPPNGNSHLSPSGRRREPDAASPAILSPAAGEADGVSAESMFVPPSGAEQLKILFTGDLGNSPAPLLRDTEPIGDIDYIIMESVYGNRNHEPKEQRINEFERIIKETIARGGTLVIPAFSIDRTQVLLYELNNMVEQKRIPSVPIFVDSPMAIKATEIYASNTELFNDQVKKQIAKGDNIFDFPKLEYTISKNESRDIEKMKGAKIILAGSGMSVGGRVISHEELYLPDPKNTILLVGYQTVGSLGRHLADGAKKVHIHGEKVHVRAHIETLYGYSAHKDSDHLIQFASEANQRLKRIFVVMGELKASMYLAQKINEELRIKAIVPQAGDNFDLE